MIINKQQQHLQVHVPKTGGTSLREMLMKNGWEGMPHHSTLSFLKKDKETYQNYFKTVMVRNPWEHAVSFYGFLLNKVHFNIQDFESGRKYKEINAEQVTPENVTFSKFIKQTYVKRLYQSAHTQELPELGLIYDHWFDYADFEDMLTFFEDKFTIKVDRTIRMQDKRKIKYVINFDNDKPFQSYYDEETYELVKNVSQKEIKMFDYKF
jgi:hypothetical protein